MLQIFFIDLGFNIITNYLYFIVIYYMIFINLFIQNTINMLTNFLHENKKLRNLRKGNYFEILDEADFLFFWLAVVK